jgi:hypothetical protein
MRGKQYDAAEMNSSANSLPTVFWGYKFRCRQAWPDLAQPIDLNAISGIDWGCQRELK